MLKKDNYFLFALLFSCVLHLSIIGYAMNQRNAKGIETGEIYESVEYIGVESTNNEGAINNSNNKVFPFNAVLDFVLLESQDKDKLEPKNLEVVSIVERLTLKQAHKNIPVDKNPAVKPKLIYSAAIPYPIRAGAAEGVVVVCILVGIDGIPEYVSTAQSSGNPLLDAAAIDNCIYWRFSPAKDGGGRRVRCLTYIPVHVRP